MTGAPKKTRPATSDNDNVLVDHQAQSTRLMKGSSLSGTQYKFQEEKSDLSKSNRGNGEANNPSLESHGSESGSNRKLMTNTSSTSTTATSENGKNGHQENNNLGGKEENFSVNSSPLTQHQPETTFDHYPDILDIAGMDYSPARRKPPIHN
ncbi:hypothetical protein ACH5RR_004408 [Cinchona calisaya]|uniref:Uncharacterized protein n=1 Tax=Cinchona calisaya TaxID=153742 RepID=A0ABD3AYD6_9GENT